MALSERLHVGVDVEAVPARDTGDAQVVWSALTPAERLRVERAPAAERCSEFLRAWTIKEACAKSTGDGMWRDLDHLETSVDPPGVTDLRAGGGTGVRPASLHQERWLLGDAAHWVAVATRVRRR